MKESKKVGILVNGSIRAAGVTLYTRCGKTVVRAAKSQQPRRNTRGQFVARQRMKHATALWQMLRLVNPVFDGGNSSYGRFCTLMRRLPVVFTPRVGPTSGATLLLPEMPVSDGPLPVVRQWLGEVDGVPALLTDLKKSALHRGDELCLYTLHQGLEGRKPVVRVSCQRFTPSDWMNGRSSGDVTPRVVDGCIALTGSVFADTMTGWALVRFNGGQCSSQTVVTQCTYYQSFATEEALLEAAATYGGLTGE